jgi:preprotein translocase subunit Sec63
MLDNSPTSAQFYEIYNDSDSLLVSDSRELGSVLLGTVEPYWDGCRWFKVKDHNGNLIAHVSRFAQQLPRSVIVDILREAQRN